MKCDRKSKRKKKCKESLKEFEHYYSKTKGEKVLDLMKNMSRSKTDEKVEVLMDRFENMVTEVRRID